MIFELLSFNIVVKLEIYNDSLFKTSLFINFSFLLTKYVSCFFWLLEPSVVLSLRAEHSFNLTWEESYKICLSVKSKYFHINIIKIERSNNNLSRPLSLCWKRSFQTLKHILHKSTVLSFLFLLSTLCIFITSPFIYKVKREESFVIVSRRIIYITH